MVTDVIENIKWPFILTLNKLVTAPLFFLDSHTTCQDITTKIDPIHKTNSVTWKSLWKSWHNSMLCNMFIHIKQIRIQITQNTSIIFILNTFNFWCMRIKIMHLCIICITNWNMKHLIFWIIFTKYIWSIQPFIELLLSCNGICLNLVINKNKILIYCSLTIKFKLCRFSFWTRLFTFSNILFFDDLYFYSVYCFIFFLGWIMNYYKHFYFNINDLWK